MGQYFIACNLDRKEFLEPYWFGHGLSLPDIARTAEGMMTGLTILLALSGSENYRDGPIYGRWAGDRIVLLGQYYQGVVSDLSVRTEDTYFRIADQEDGWVEIGEHVRQVLEQDWRLILPPPFLDGAEPRSILHPDGTIAAIPQSPDLMSEENVGARPGTSGESS